MTKTYITIIDKQERQHSTRKKALAYAKRTLWRWAVGSVARVEMRGTVQLPQRRGVRSVVRTVRKYGEAA